MKKYLLFAAVAGMLASCSSDSLISGSDPKIEPTNQEDLVPIEIGVASAQTKATTRGTGTTGGTGADNIWRGERVNVLMYLLTDDGLPTFNYTKDASGTNLYENTPMVTPLKEEATATGIAKEPKVAGQIGWNNPQYTYIVKYYPSIVRSDFWGYYLGGYDVNDDLDAPAGDGTLTMYTSEGLTTSTLTEAEAKCVATGIKIDGTHDLLVGKALSESELTTTTSPASTDPGADAIYSAKAARKGIQPNIEFKHLLSRLQFKVKPGTANADGVMVDSIKIRSLQTGKMIVAYKYNSLTLDDKTDRIVWDAAETALAYDARPQLELKRRFSAADKTAYDALDGADPYKVAHPSLTDDSIGHMVDIYPVTLKWVGYEAVPNTTVLTNGVTYYTDDQGGGAFVSDGTEVATGSNYFEMKSPFVSSVGESLLVAPQDKYQIEVVFHMDVQTARNWYESSYTAVPNTTVLTGGETYYTDNQGGGEFVAAGTEVANGTNYFELTFDGYGEGELVGGKTTFKDRVIADVVRTTLTGGAGSAPKAFEAGESYLITVTLYGPEEIKITTTLTPWTPSDDDIEVGLD